MCSEIFVAPELPQQIFTTSNFLNGTRCMDRNCCILEQRKRRAEESRTPSLVEYFGNQNSKHNNSRRALRVKFHSLATVRSYNTVLGDNPSVCDGPPVSLGWKYTTKQLSMTSLDDYLDDARTTKCASNPNECHLDATVRFERLKSKGISNREIEDAVIEINRIKRSRRANSIRSTVMVVTRTPSSDADNNTTANTNANTSPKARQGGLLTWGTTPQRSSFPPRVSRRTPVSSSAWPFQQRQRIRQHQIKTPFPRPPSVSLPST